MGKKLKIESSKRRQSWQFFGEKEEGGGVLDPYIEIKGNKAITLDGCLGVMEYKDSYIKLRLKKGSLILCGAEFNITFFEKRLITVKGRISSIEFCV